MTFQKVVIIIKLTPTNLSERRIYPRYYGCQASDAGTEFDGVILMVHEKLLVFSNI